jgi:hypothetical protein
MRGRRQKDTTPPELGGPALPEADPSDELRTVELSRGERDLIEQVRDQFAHRSLDSTQTETLTTLLGRWDVAETVEA